MNRFKLNLTALTTILLLASPTIAIADARYDALPSEDQIEQETIEAAKDALNETESLATSISFAFDYLTTFMSEAHPPDFLTHAELKATTARLDGVRSILVIDKDGMIRHDAFSFPAPNINVAERQYFQGARSSSGLILGEGVIGRTSGVPFVPVSTYKPALNAVLTAIVDPGKLRRVLERCGRAREACGAAILTNTGKIVASSIPEVTIPQEIVDNILGAEDNSGTFVYERQNFKALVAFRKSERFPIVAFASHGIASNSVLATQ